jgi:hypothetical protein
MAPRFQSLFLALLTALLIILGTVGIFSAEASSFRVLIQEAQSYDKVTPIEAYTVSPDTSATMPVPGSPY